MNIKQAKEYIRNTVDLYLKKDSYGEYRIPVVRQRPVFLLGAPGVGKTAIMEQIAQELFYDPSYPAVGTGAAFHRGKGIRGDEISGIGVYHE